MATFEELCNRLARVSVQNRLSEELGQTTWDGFGPHHLDCLLNPSKYTPVIRVGDCGCTDKSDTSCAGEYLFDALYCDENGNISINKDLCAGCSECVNNCHAKKLTESHDILPTLTAIQHAGTPVYAMVAPAFISQFSSDVTPDGLHSTFKKIGLDGMVETALFADVLTLREALEFDKNIQKEEDYQLTSCCCPMWISMIRKMYKQLTLRVSGTASPMVTCGRPIKTMYPGAITIFIGPCLAKKVEVRESDVPDSTDFVLTFREIKNVFNFAGIDLTSMPEDERDHSSHAGRIYAGTSGVSEAVQSTVARLNPDRKISVRATHTDGVRACKEMLSSTLEGRLTANFIEGMGCVGDCVGGPKALVPKEEDRKNVFEYGNTAAYPIPIDNPYVIELLHHLGFDTVGDLPEKSDAFTRQL